MASPRTWICAVVIFASRSCALAPPAARRVVAVGIDLGTTNSAVCVYDRARCEPVAVRNSRGDVLTPSVVSFLSSGEVLVGRDAIDAAASNPHSTFRSIKRLLGRDLATDAERALANRLLPTKDSLLRGSSGVRLNCPALGRELRLEEVSAAVLRALASDVLAYLRAAGGEPGGELGLDDLRCVITVPAQFDDEQREATEVAARLAGLQHVRLMREPVAAALAFGVMGQALDPADGAVAGGAGASGRAGSAGGVAEGPAGAAAAAGDEAERTVLVIDVGAGTTDVSVLSVSQGLVQVLANSADGRLGGDDIDDALEAWLLRTLCETGHATVAEAIRAEPALRFGARRSLEAAKVSLSVRKEASVTLPCTAAAQPASVSSPPLCVPLSRADLDSASEPVLALLKRPIYEAALNARLTLQGERESAQGKTAGGSRAAEGRGRGKGTGGIRGKTGGGRKEGGGRPTEPMAGEMARTSDGQLERSRALPAGRALDALVMVGGMSHMLGVRKLAANLAGVDVRRTVDPMEAVARGAALQAAVTEGLATGLAVEDAWQAQLTAAYRKLEQQLAARAARERAWADGAAARAAAGATAGQGAGAGGEAVPGGAGAEAADWAEIGGGFDEEEDDEAEAAFAAFGFEEGDEVVWLDDDGSEVPAEVRPRPSVGS